MAIDTQDIRARRRDALQVELAAEFPAEHDSPGCARRLVVAALQEWGCEQEALVDDVALVVTELASNVVLHAGTPFSISLRAQDSILYVAACDGVPPAASGRDGWMTPRPLHGLDLIDTLSTRWGIERTPGGKVVWAELAYEAPHVRRFKPRVLA